MNEEIAFRGQLSIGDNIVSYNVSKVNSKEDYEYLLKVSLLDPTHKRIYQNQALKNKALKNISSEIEKINSSESMDCSSLATLEKKKKDIEEGRVKFNAETSRYIKEGKLTDGIVKKMAEECAVRLIAKFELSLLNAFKKNPRIGNMNSNQMCSLFLDDYLKSLPRCSSSTLDNKRRNISQACEILMMKNISDLDEKDIGKLFEQEKFKKIKKQIADFFEYGRNNNAYSGKNPIRDFLEANHVKVKKKTVPYSSEISHIPGASEIVLHNLIEKHINDPEIMGVILVKCAGLSLAEALRIRWGELIDDGDCIVFINIVSHNGIERNLSRPVLREGTDLIRLVMENKEKKYGPKTGWDKELVVSIRNTKTEKKTTKMTDYIRKLLIDAQLSNKSISSSSPDNKNVGGAGAALLKKHYEYVLTARCGLDPDSEEYAYMRGITPNSILGKHYRSMNDVISGLPYFKTIVRRDDCHIPMKGREPSSKIEKNGNEQLITISSAGSRNRTMVTLEFPVIAGTQISIMSNYGITGESHLLSGSNVRPVEIKTLY